MRKHSIKPSEDIKAQDCRKVVGLLSGGSDLDGLIWEEKERPSGRDLIVKLPNPRGAVLLSLIFFEGCASFQCREQDSHVIQK